MQKICTNCFMKIDSFANEPFNKLFTYDSTNEINYYSKDFVNHDHILCDNQPERSKREDSHQCEMRCSEHCGNTVRGK